MYMYAHTQFSGATPEQLVAAIKYFLQGKGAEKGLRWEEGRKDGGGGGGEEGGRRGKGWRGVGGGEKDEGRMGEGEKDGGREKEGEGWREGGRRVGGKWGMRKKCMNVIASHEYIEHIHSGEEERQLSGEEGVKERTIERRSAGEEEEGGDEGAVGRGDREESEEQPIIPDPVTVDSSLPTTTVQIRLADGSR